ncbi:MAG: ABC transporter permease [Clostridiales bacterium]|jgi:putative ABC transport system permease protein|nr:ABC transporter permease [Clostridiales bacterium]MDR2752660.1 ABC transporter permease [Clostridiales bacterium]
MLLENLGLALESLRANKMRAMLTMLGIIIGISSVIAILSIGNSLTNGLSSEVGSLGASTVYVSLTAKTSSGSTADVLSVPRINDQDLLSEDLINQFAETYSENVKAISLNQNVADGTAREGKRYANMSIVGVNTGYGMANEVELVKGRFINDKDVVGVKSVGVISDKAAKNLYGNEDPLLKEAKVYTQKGVRSYTIVGVYKSKETPGASSMANEKDSSTSVYIPLSTASQETGTKGYSSFAAIAADQKVSLLGEKIDKFFGANYRNEKWEIKTINMESELESIIKMLGMASMAVGVIAGISLVVGGVGVMNIMLVSVTERTREIGARKALGAKRSHIRAQFVIESVILSLAGGVIGITLGVAIASLFAMFAKQTLSLDIRQIAMCVAFSMAIGIFFGYYPANKASKLDPIEALRYE